jgi:hypothetical protein
LAKALATICMGGKGNNKLSCEKAFIRESIKTSKEEQTIQDTGRICIMRLRTIAQRTACAT